MIEVTKHQLALQDLLEKLPNYNTAYAEKELSNILEEYRSILNSLQNINEDLRRNTKGHFSEISGIEREIHNTKWAKSDKARDLAFNDARKHLESDIQALIHLIRRSQ